jgi:hypothetical protein
MLRSNDFVGAEEKLFAVLVQARHLLRLIREEETVSLLGRTKNGQQVLHEAAVALNRLCKLVRKRYLRFKEANRRRRHWSHLPLRTEMSLRSYYGDDVTLKSILEKSDEELLRVPNFGNYSLKNLRELGMGN